VYKLISRSFVSFNYIINRMASGQSIFIKIKSIRTQDLAVVNIN